jgi:hypothetical protein
MEPTKTELSNLRGPIETIVWYGVSLVSESSNGSICMVCIDGPSNDLRRKLSPDLAHRPAVLV